MTENEAIIRFDFIRCALLGGTKPHIMPNEENIGLVNAAIQALEEVRQYRAIGTPEECQEAMKKQNVIKPIAVLGTFGGTEYECKNCGSNVPYGHEYCDWCGQKLDWSDE